MDLYDLRTALQSGKTIYELPLRVTFYARVSTDKEEQRHSLQAQAAYYTAFIAGCPTWTPVEGYIDEGISGTSVGKREQFLRMIDDAQAGKFDFILTKEISRFSRNTLDSIRYTQTLLRCGVGVLFQSDNINTLLPDAELRLTIMSSIAQDEVRKISERVKFGFRRAIEQGVVLGNSQIWGYEKRDGKLVLQEEEAEMVRLIFDLYANRRLGIRTIAARLEEQGYHSRGGKELSFSTIRGILSNPKYKGYYCGGKSCKYDYHLSTRKQIAPADWVMYRDEEKVPPIVSEELWDKANALLHRRSAARRQTRGSGQSRYGYSGKIFCTGHQTAYHRALYRYPSGDKEVWQCPAYARKGKKGCTHPVVYTSELDALLLQALDRTCDRGRLTRVLLSLYRRGREAGENSTQLAKCRRAMEELDRRKERLLDLNLGGHLSDGEFAQRNESYNRELARLKQRAEALAGEGDSLPEDLEARIREALKFPGGIPAGVTDALLDRLEVGEPSDPAVLSLRAVWRDGTESVCTIQRRRGRPSVCTVSYT